MVDVSWIDVGSKTNGEGMSSSAGGQFGDGSEVWSVIGGDIGESGIVSNLVLNSTEIKPPYFLLAHKIPVSEAIAKHFRTAYDDYRENIDV